jgi:hypothetical protein
MWAARCVVKAIDTLWRTTATLLNMPVSFECDECKLGFELGLFHQHDHSDGYSGHRLMVCQKCGCQHCLRVPFHDNTETPQILMSQKSALFKVAKRSSKLLIRYTDYANHENCCGVELGALKCQHCESSVPLTTEWPSKSGDCPACGHLILESIGTWFT